MRLTHFMNISTPDETTSKFRSLKIGIVKEETGYDDIITSLSEKYPYIKESIDLVDKMNKVFRSTCKGMYRFKYRLCIDEDIHPSDLKIDSSSRKKIVLKSHEINDEFTKIKRRLESDLTNI